MDLRHNGVVNLPIGTNVRCACRVTCAQRSRARTERRSLRRLQVTSDTYAAPTLALFRPEVITHGHGILLKRLAVAVSLSTSVVLLSSACDRMGGTTMQTDLEDFATRYAAAWSSQSPDSLASFYAESGALIVNDGTPSVGRSAIRATAGSFMTAFPDMLVVMDSLIDHGNNAMFHWTWTGTNTGPGGTGRPVWTTGYEEWTFQPGRTHS